MTYSTEEAEKETLRYFDGDTLATNVFISKYALRNADGELLECTPDDMHHRLAKEFARIEEKYSFGTPPAPHMEEDGIYGLFKDFACVVPQGSPMAGIGDDDRLVSLSNCVVIASPDDSISGIMETGKTLANLCKYRCGVGLDISSLRPEGMAVNNAAKTTSGGWTFADLYSSIINMIGQNGRRGALMISIDVSHPDVEKFITMKKDRRKVTGANISVKLSDEFMEAVRNDAPFHLTWKGKTYKIVEAKELFELITETATETAEPGILLWDRVIDDVPLQCYAKDGFDHVGVNPCAELSLSAYDSCRLMTINLAAPALVSNPFTPSAKFHWEAFGAIVQNAAILSDDLIDLEVEKLDRIIESVSEDDIKEAFGKLKESALSGRRTGLGTHGLADLLIKMNLTYGSDEAVEFTERLYDAFKNEAYYASTLLAEQRGPFPLWDWEKEKDNKFIQSLSEHTKDAIKDRGRRNGSMLTCAPAGSVSIVSQTSSGVEPIFALSYTRRRKLDGDAQDADFVDDLGVSWEEYSVNHPLLDEYRRVTGKDDTPETFVISSDIEPHDRLRMQAAMQKGIDHQISSTINLPKGTTSDVVGKIYMDAYLLGLKGVTVYVDGSRDNVLRTSDEDCDCTSFAPRSAPKRPEFLPCDIHHLVVHGEKWTVFVSHIDGMPFEVFGGRSDKITLPKKYASGTIRKKSRKTTRNRYDLLCGEGDEALEIRDLVSVFENPNNLALTRMISLSLRHGAAVGFVCDQLNSDEGSDMFSFAKSVARVLKRYIRDGAASGSRCDQCGEKLRYEGGCVLCPSCGASRC